MRQAEEIDNHAFPLSLKVRPVLSRMGSKSFTGK